VYVLIVVGANVAFRIALQTRIAVPNDRPTRLGARGIVAIGQLDDLLVCPILGTTNLAAQHGPPDDLRRHAGLPTGLLDGILTGLLDGILAGLSVGT